MVIGDVAASALLDAIGDLGEVADLCPATPDADAYREAYPQLFDGSNLRFPCACYLLRSGGTNVLVDTGVGPPDLWEEFETELRGGLPAALAAEGVAPDDVDVVFFTHLHIDHVGWNTRDGRLSFPKARYVVHRDALVYARGDGRRDHMARTIDPVAFDEIDGETQLAPGIEAVPLPGHYPGHMGVRIRSGGAEALVLGDAAAHPLLLDRPDDTFANDIDPEASIETRRRLVPELVDNGVLVLCGHYPDGGIGRVVRHDGRILWTTA